MNKDVIYIEPEDDITDIISKIEKSKHKIVALVPPKKAGVFRSIVNIKLIAKAGAASEKTIVLVTTDSSIIKLAGNAKIPVTKDLQSAPSIPDVKEEDTDTEKAEVVEKATDEKIAVVEESDEDEDATEGAAEDEESDEDEEEDEKPVKAKEARNKGKKSDANGAKASGNKFANWIKEHKKLAIASGIGIVLLILFLVWALFIAPAANLIVEIKTDSNNFSESVNFTTKLSDENLENGTFYLDEKKIESVQETKFEATGKKNIGKKATGEIIVYAYFPLNVKASAQIAEGETFTISGLVYKATESETLSYDGEGKTQCSNKDNSDGLVDYGCRINGVVSVEASEPGTNYNIAASSTGWDTNARVFAYSESPMSGGTDETITIVQQSDVDKAKSELVATDESESKKKLIEEIGDDAIVIDSSFSQSASDAVVTPAVGEEVKDGEKVTLKATTVASIYALDKVKVEEFITKKANLKDDQKIYEMKNPFIENFMKTDTGFAGKLKTSYATGPKITENDVIAIVKGKGLGEAQHDLKDINGVASVTINPSFPWVTKIPNDSNKISVNFEVKDQNGNKIEQSEAKESNNEESDDKESEENKESKDSESNKNTEQ